MARSALGISAILASTSASPSALALPRRSSALISRARSLIAAFSSAVNPFRVSFFGLMATSSGLEDRQVELCQALRVGQEVQLDDLAIADRNRPDRERLSVAHGDRPHRPV